KWGWQAPPVLRAIHRSMRGTVPADIDKASQAGGPPPAGLSADEKRAYEGLAFTYKHVAMYQEMASRPQTLYGFADSPVSLAAYLLDHGDAGGQPAAALVAGVRRTSSPAGGLPRAGDLDAFHPYLSTHT